MSYPGGMRLRTLALLLTIATPAFAQIPPVDRAPQTASCADVAAMYDQMTANVEAEFAKLVNEAKNAKDQLEKSAQQIKEKIKQLKELEAEIADLDSEKAKMVAELAKQKAKAVADCTKAARTQLATPCGSIATKQVVVVVEPASGASASMVKGWRRSPAVAILGSTGEGTIRASVDSPLVLDNASTLLSNDGTRLERARREVAAILLRRAGMAILHLDAALTPAQRAIATRRGWRIATGDSDAALKAAICAP